MNSAMEIGVNCPIVGLSIEFRKNSNIGITNKVLGSQKWESTKADDWQPLVDWGYETEPQIVSLLLIYLTESTP